MLVVALVLVSLIAAVEFVMLTRPTKLPYRTAKALYGLEAATNYKRQILIEVLALGGLKPAKRYKLGPTDRTVMSDGCTTINLVDKLDSGSTAHFAGNFISLISWNPLEDSNNALQILLRIDDGVELSSVPITDQISERLYRVHSPLLRLTFEFGKSEWDLTGQPPNQIPV